MRNLKIILGITYPILILLLILLNFRSCEPQEPYHPPVGGHEPDTTGRTDTATIRQVTEIGGMGDLKVTLLWDFYGDIDLHIIQPKGKEIYWNFKKDGSTGGFLDVDNQIGGPGSAENIYWEHPPKGQYTVKLHYFNRSVSEESGICTVVVMQRGEQVKEYKIPMDHKGQIKDVTVVRID